ncbi:MAG: endonuclease/exonuclease/phosphatase family protein [Vicinamibacterales bacterium]
MKQLTFLLVAALSLCAVLQAAAARAAGAETGAGSPAAAVKIATWNMEWLLSPATFNELAPICTRDDEKPKPRSIPCDVAANLERSASDFDALAKRARELDADVIALQEVDGASAARLVFREHEFCFSGSHVVQNTGFAIRRGVPFRCGDDVRGLSLGDTLRRGAVVVLYPGTDRELWLLDVHLKAGCTRQLLDQGGDVCHRLAHQVPFLEGWIDAQARAGHRFAVLGDFNRVLLAEKGEARAPDGQQRNVWREIDDGDPPGATLFNSAEGQRFANCTPGQAHNGFIDHILLGERLTPMLVAASFQQLTWTARETWRGKLTDHCPIAVRLQFRP